MTLPRLNELPGTLRHLFTAFLVVAAAGYFLGAFFVEHTTRLEPDGVVERFKGTEAMGYDLDELPADRELQYEKSKTDILNITHTHVLALAMLFLLTGIIFAFTTVLPSWLKTVFLIEPFLSIILTFGGMWGLRYHADWWTIVIAVSGTFMTLSFSVMVLVSLYELWRKPVPIP
ncbi:MAG: hypothetical protein CL946_08100 [Ectothiorhodospiraceae bacterium]|nr:hypothetical protein [Ectothiorhodospiraceae bacterium]